MILVNHSQGLAQPTPPARLEFEVASIRASQFQSIDGEASLRESIDISPDGVTMLNVTLQSCIGWAYSVQDFQITGVLGSNRFDIAAKAAAPATGPTLRAMLRTLLAERSNLRFIGTPKGENLWLL
jgi:uncharacterized protein (TIGR03435 family)